MKSRGQSTESGFFGKLFTFVTGVTLLAVGFLFSVVVLAGIAVAILAASGYIWWKTRKIRQVMKNDTSTGHVIEGEVIVVNEFKEEGRSTLPRDPPV